MRIKRLVKDIPLLQVKGSKEVDITGVCSNSQCIAPGNLFIAKKGRQHDGTRFIPEAIAGGAAAVLSDIYDPSLKNIVQLIHPNIEVAEALLATRYYNFPSERLFMVGITGTNGKTTIATLLKHLLDSVDISCGLIGTIEYIIGPHRHHASRTTPDLCANQKMLAEMVREGCEAAVMEVTSHALDQGRVVNIDFDVAIFTNLTPEHLDYHQTMEQYAEAKRLLFCNLYHTSDKKVGLSQPVAIVNYDCPWHTKLLEDCQARVLTYGLSKEADLYAKDIQLSAEGSRFSLEYQGEQALFQIPLAGRFNVYNALAVIATGLCKGIALQTIADSLTRFTSVPGRLEPVPNPLGLKIYVDFAHTDDALENTLSCLQELKKGRLITVFGCGGDRDRGKRPKMAKVSEALSDMTIVTSDNPRSEKPEDICSEITRGFSNNAHFMVELDRREAIQKAIYLAQPDDIILIAGKGHERQQIFAHQTIEFCDVSVARELCEDIATN